MPDGAGPLLIAILLLLLLSGFFSSMETAYSCANKIKLRTLSANGNRRARKTLHLAENYDKLISTILVGNNIVNITMSSLATLFFAILMSNSANSVTVSTIVTTVAVLIAGEITPKMIAKIYPEKFAMFGYPLMMLFYFILFPINIIFTGYKFLLSKIFKLKNEEVVTEDEIMTIVEEAREDGTLHTEETQLIRSVIEFDDLEVGDILIPRVNITAVDIKASPDEVKKIFTKCGYSRIPVYENSVDTIVGIVHEKDFFLNYFGTKKDIRTILNSPIYTTEHIKISVLLKQLQKKKTHMAIVLDEYGGTAGIVTLEDILEELVGEIWDEHDEEVNYFKKIDENVTMVDANAPLCDLFAYYELDEDDDNFEAYTVSGWIIEQLCEIPTAGTRFEFAGLSIEVKKSSLKKIQQVKITRLSEEELKEKEKELKNEE